MKKRVFGLILIVVIVALAYFYVKGKQLVPSKGAPENPAVPDYKTIYAKEEQQRKIRAVANDCFRDLKGWGVLHPEPYKPLLTFTKEQFAAFVEFYRTLYSKGFMHHIDHQSSAWNRTSELYQLKLSLNRLLA